MIAGRINWPRRRVAAFATLIAMATVVVVLTVLAASPPVSSRRAAVDAAAAAGAVAVATPSDPAGPTRGDGTGRTAGGRSVAGRLRLDLPFVISDGPALEFTRMVLRSPDVEAPDDVRAYVQRTDLALVAIEPSVSYLAMLADRTLRGEAEILRLLAEAGGGSDAAAAVTFAGTRRSGGLATVDLQRILAILNSASIGSQQSTIATITGPPAINESLQRRLVGSAIRLYLDLLTALELVVNERDKLLGIGAEAGVGSPTRVAALEAATPAPSAPS